MQDSQIALIVVVLVIGGVGFLICREIVTWYFKLNELSRKLDTTNKTLADIRDLLAISAAANAAPPAAPAPAGTPLPSALKGFTPPSPK